jgi:hypothetical protein
VARVTYKGLNLTNVRFQPQKRERRA